MVSGGTRFWLVKDRKVTVWRWPNRRRDGTLADSRSSGEKGAREISTGFSLCSIVDSTGRFSGKGKWSLRNPAINRHATSCLDDCFKGSRRDLFSGTGGNENYVVRLQIDVRRFCGQNILKRDLCLLWRAFRSRFTNQLSSVESSTGAGALRHCVGLENRHVRVLHHEPTGQANISDDVDNSRFRHHNRVAGIHIDIALAGHLAVVGHGYNFRFLRVGAMQK